MYDYKVDEGGGLKVGQTYSSRDGKQQRTITELYYDEWRNCFNVIYSTPSGGRGDCFDRAFRYWAGVKKYPASKAA